MENERQNENDREYNLKCWNVHKSVASSRVYRHQTLFFFPFLLLFLIKRSKNTQFQFNLWIYVFDTRDKWIQTTLNHIYIHRNEKQRQIHTYAWYAFYHSFATLKLNQKKKIVNWKKKLMRQLLLYTLYKHTFQQIENMIEEKKNKRNTKQRRWIERMRRRHSICLFKSAF